MGAPRSSGGTDGGGRGKAPASGRALIREAAEQMRGWGWEPPLPGWNVASAYEALKEALWLELDTWSRGALDDAPKGEIRRRRRAAWAIQNCIHDLGETNERTRGRFANPETAGLGSCDGQRLEKMLARTLADFVLGTEHNETHKRAVLVLTGVGRLFARLSQLEITEPIARVRASAAGESAAGVGGVRREGAIEGFGSGREVEAESEREIEEEEEGHCRASDADARRGRTRVGGVDDGWDD